ncbi:MAG TPA: hypothetical protein DCS93_22340 [Microscillaceae bacterium]|nr:hypothetical protein [Microscillaceae bacterium]
MKHYKSKYSEVDFDENFQLLTVTWNPNTEDMDSDTFRKELLSKIELVKHYKPQFHLIDSREFHYVISPDEQIWVSENIFPGYAQNGVRQLAFLVSEDFIAQLSISQSIEEDKTAAFRVKYFSDMVEAKSWLFELDKVS